MVVHWAVYLAAMWAALTDGRSVECSVATLVVWRAAPTASTKVARLVARKVSAKADWLDCSPADDLVDHWAALSVVEWALYLVGRLVDSMVEQRVVLTVVHLA